MTELKTLKELIHKVELDYLDDNEKIATYEAIEVDKLRAEAIKWIKELTENDDYDKFSYFDGYCLKHSCVDQCYPSIGISWEECSDIPAVIMWIKHFFNITEDELK